VLGGRSLNVEAARIVAEASPGIQRFVRTDRISIHGSSIRQQTKYRKPCQEAGSDSAIRLLIPPRFRNVMGDVTLDKQRKEDVSVRDTRHSDA
jgi:hypothetical protein